MAKKRINKSNYQLEMKIDSDDSKEKGNIEKGNIEKVQNEKATEIETTFTRHVGPREVIENDILKLYPIQSGEIALFKAKKGFGFIRPDDLGRQNIFMKDSERIFKQGEEVKYIEINDEALVTSKGVVKLKSVTGDTIKLIIQAGDGAKDFTLVLDPTFPHNKVEGHANVADKSRPEYSADLKDFNNGDEVEFIANKKGIIVAIQKK